MEWTMEWTDGMDRWNGISANQIAETHHRGRGEVVSAVSTIASTITVRETTALLVPYLQVAQADPSESCPRFDSHEPGQTQIVSTSMHSSLATCI